MSAMKRIIFLLFIALIIPMAGCTDAPLSHGVSAPSMAIDNKGGVYVLYQVYHNFRYEYYLQKLASDGSKLWGEKGILVTSKPGNDKLEGQRVFANNDNFIAVCANNISSISPEGEILWSKNFPDMQRVDNTISDGAGGVIYLTNDLSLKRIDDRGNTVWSTPPNTTDDSAWLKVSSDERGWRFFDHH